MRRWDITGNKKMKKIKKSIVAFSTLAVLASTMMVSCESFSNMSNEDAYYIGAGIGTATRVLMEN